MYEIVTKDILNTLNYDVSSYYLLNTIIIFFYILGTNGN